MRTMFLCLAVLLVVPPTGAEPGRVPRQKLEALKKRLPALLCDWLKEKENDNWLPGEGTCKPELRVMRLVGPDRAKAVILFAVYDKDGARTRYHDLLLTFFLTYEDGCWTTERFEVTSRDNGDALRRFFAFLMLTIDGAAEK